VKIGRYLAKIWTKSNILYFLGHPVFKPICNYQNVIKIPAYKFLNIFTVASLTAVGHMSVRVSTSTQKKNFKIGVTLWKFSSGQEYCLPRQSCELITATTVAAVWFASCNKTGVCSSHCQQVLEQ